MASAAYPYLFVNSLKGDTPLDSGDVKALLYDSADGAYDPSDNDVADLVAGGIAGARSAALGSKTFAVASNVMTFDAANTTITACPLGDLSERIIVYYDPGTGDANCLLIADLLLETAITPNGGDISVAFSESGIVAITCTAP